MKILKQVVPQIETLENMLLNVIGSESWMENDATRSFLQQTFVGQRHGARRDLSTFNRDVLLSQAELLNIVIKELLKRKRLGMQKWNLLTVGYDTAGQGPHNHFLENDVSCYYPNTLVSKLKSAVWANLHDCIGDDLMKLLLLDYYIFVTLDVDRQCYMQVAGEIIRFPAQGDNDFKLSLKRLVFTLRPHVLSSFVKGHILSESPISKQAARRVISHIFNIGSTKRFNGRLRNAIPIVQDMMARFQKCDIMSVVGRLCPLPSACKQLLLDRDKTVSELKSTLHSPWNTTDIDLEDEGFASQDNSEIPRRQRKRNLTSQSGSHRAKRIKRLSNEEYISALLEYDSPKDEVYELLRYVLDSVLPKALWGTAKNHKRFLQHLHRYVNAQFHDILDINKILDGLSVNCITWMNIRPNSVCVPSEIAKRKLMMRSLLSWIWSELVVTLIRQFFYVTTKEGTFNRIYFYRHCIWNKLIQLGTRDLIDGVMNKVSKNPHQSISVSTLRFQPKLHGIRPIVNLSRSIKLGRSVNQSLQLAFQILKAECQNISLGASVTCLSETCDRLNTFRSSWRLQNSPQLYFVKLDIEKCFDTINTQRLLNMLPNYLRQECYMVRKHYVVRRSNKNVMYKTRYHVLSPSDYKRFEDIVVENSSMNTIYIDGVLYKYMKRCDVLETLKSHLLRNYVSINREFFLQKKGIPQGSLLSSLLCNMYYANFEQNVLSPQLHLLPGHDLLLRYTDDFLLLTTNKSKAQTFENIMHLGHKPYGCHINERKTRSNLNGFECVEWCGLIIDPSNLSIQSSYNKYVTTKGALRSTVAIDASRSLSKWLFDQLASPVLFRCHPIFFCYVPEESVKMNMYHMLALVAAKYAHIVCNLPNQYRQNPKIKRGVSSQNFTISLTWPQVKEMGLHAILNASKKYSIPANHFSLFEKEWTTRIDDHVDIDQILSHPSSRFIDLL
ncbi:hypothetical protein AeRB84_014641 [Aphanomyces euteiches]|nr:hypothetical protein AeRB84_014641 [Aphanomyces euteiches]